jgi:hypothetical protein
VLGLCAEELMLPKHFERNGQFYIAGGTVIKA